MAVHCKQIVDGIAQSEYIIEPHSDTQTDSELLKVKALGAEDKGWSVTWTSETSFSAFKIRWQPQNEVVREFWVE